MADDALDMNAVNVNDIVRQAVDGINVDKKGQELAIKHTGEQPLTLTDRHVQIVVNLLQSHPRAVGSLIMVSLSLTPQAVEILRAYFVRNRRTMSLKHIRLQVNLGNIDGGRLLSGLHGNNSITRVDLYRVGLVGQAGGAVLSELLQHNLSLQGLRLGVEGARALQAGVRANQTVKFLGLGMCDIGDEGVSLIVDALHGNTTITHLCLRMNGITSNDGLPHVTRLLQHHTLRLIAFSHHPGLFDNQDNFGPFLIALQNSQVTDVDMNGCQLPGRNMVPLFQALLLKTTPTHLCVSDNDQLQGEYLELVLDVIPQMQNLLGLEINLDFMDASVLSSFRRNTSIQNMARYIDFTQEKISNGPVFEILKRNRRICQATELLDSEPRRMIPLGLWSTAIEHLTRDDNTGATAAYKIMQKKLVAWWNSQLTATAPSPSPRPSSVAAAAAAVAMVAISTTAIHNNTPPSSGTTSGPTVEPTNGPTSLTSLPAKRSLHDQDSTSTKQDDDDNHAETPRKKRARSAGQP